MTCEVCHKAQAISLSHLRGQWLLTCMCTADTEDYYVEFTRYLKEGPEVWLRHLLGKQWFNQVDFLQAVFRADLLPSKPILH